MDGNTQYLRLRLQQRRHYCRQLQDLCRAARERVCRADEKRPLWLQSRYPKSPFTKVKCPLPLGSSILEKVAAFYFIPKNISKYVITIFESQFITLQVLLLRENIKKYTYFALARNCIQLAACGSDQLLPMSPDLPADLFTACLTTPIKVALRKIMKSFDCSDSS